MTTILEEFEPQVIDERERFQCPQLAHQFSRHILGPEMGVAKQHAGITVATDQGHLRYCETSIISFLKWFTVFHFCSDLGMPKIHLTPLRGGVRFH